MHDIALAYMRLCSCSAPGSTYCSGLAEDSMQMTAYHFEAQELTV